MFTRLIVATAALAGVSACTHIPSQEQINNPQNYGPAPTNVEQLVRAFYAANLVDPGSVIYDSIGPAQPYYLPDWASGTTIYGWRTCVRLNAKNRMGGYTGASTEALFFRGQQVVHHIENAPEQVCPR